MKVIETIIKDLLILEPKVYKDNRGYFLESYNQKEFEDLSLQTLFVQDNESKSFKGTLRGLHFQKPPFDQAKLVRCIGAKCYQIKLQRECI